MLDGTRLEGISLLASQNAVNALIETQTILQLMVKKGLVTPEEVAITRKIVKSQPKYKQMLQTLDSAMDKVNESAKFEELVKKALQPNGNKNLTDEERSYLLGKLDNMTKSFAKEARNKYGDSMKEMI